jgi:hypothetical protein
VRHHCHRVSCRPHHTSRPSNAPAAIHVVTSVPQGLTDLPLLLSDPSTTPQNAEANVGSRNYGARPLAVAAGGGFDDAAFQTLRDACKDVEQGVVWVRGRGALG